MWVHKQPFSSTFLFFRSLLPAKDMIFGKLKFDVKQLKMNKFIFNVVKQLKMKKLIKSIRQFIISTSNATLEVPLLCPCHDQLRNILYTQISSIGVIWKWKYLLQLNILFNVIFGQSISSSKKLKTKIRCITRYNRLNHLILLHVYQEKIIKIDIGKIASKFAAGKDSKFTSFVILKLIPSSIVAKTSNKTEEKTYWVKPLKLLEVYYFISLKQNHLPNASSILVVRNFRGITFF